LEVSILISNTETARTKKYTDFRKAKKEMGPIVANKLHSLINFLESANYLMDVKNVPIYHTIL
jgi:hypothetical protein